MIVVDLFIRKHDMRNPTILNIIHHRHLPCQACYHYMACDNAHGSLCDNFFTNGTKLFKDFTLVYNDPYLYYDKGWTGIWSDIFK